MICINFAKKMYWATFWAIFSSTDLVTLFRNPIPTNQTFIKKLLLAGMSLLTPEAYIRKRWAKNEVPRTKNIPTKTLQNLTQIIDNRFMRLR
jgi:hypothetical protein